MNQKLFNLVATALFLCGGGSCSAETASLAELRNTLHDGDIIFQQSQTRQSAALREATGSSWTHMGIVQAEGDNLRVLEAGMNGVAFASLNSFVGRSRGRRIIVKRLKNEALLTPDTHARIRAALKSDLGKDYDNLFEWSDEKMYCSELVWRAYKHGLGLSIGSVQRIRDLRYDEPAVQELINERFHLSGSQIERSTLLDEKVVTPASILSSDALVTVFEGVITE